MNNDPFEGYRQHLIEAHSDEEQAHLNHQAELEHEQDTVQPKYKVVCMDCRVTVRESEFKGMVSRCLRCDELHQRGLHENNNSVWGSPA